MFLTELIGHERIPAAVTAPKDKLEQLMGRCRDAFVAASHIGDALPVQIQIIGRLGAGRDLENKDNSPFRGLHGIQRIDGDRVKVSVNLLADEFKILLRIGHAHYAGIVVNPEEERAAVCVGKSAHALEPAANLLPLKLSLEIISRTLGNEYVVFYSHKSLMSITPAARPQSAGSLYKGRNKMRCRQIFARWEGYTSSRSTIFAYRRRLLGRFSSAST